MTKITRIRIKVRDATIRIPVVVPESYVRPEHAAAAAQRAKMVAYYTKLDSDAPKPAKRGRPRTNAKA